MEITKEILIQKFPFLRDKSDKYIEGFKEAIKAALSDDNQSQNGSQSSNSPLKQPPKQNRDNQQDNSDNQDQQNQENNSDNQSSENQSQNNSDTNSNNNSQNKSDNNSQNNSNSSGNSTQGNHTERSFGSFNPEDLEAAKELRDNQKQSSGEAQDNTSDNNDEVSSSDIINNTMNQVSKDAEDRIKNQQAIKAQKDEINRWRRDPINQFKQSVKGFFSEEDDERFNDIATPNTRRDMGDENQVTAGRKKKPSGGIPTVNIYFDQANSANQHIMDIGEQAISALRPYEEKRLLKMNIFYFARNVHSEDRHTMQNRMYMWPDGDDGSFVQPDNIIEHIKQTHADNVIILTDHNLDKCNKNIVISGAVWMFFYQGAESHKFINCLKGRQLNKYWVI